MSRTFLLLLCIALFGLASAPVRAEIPVLPTPEECAEVIEAYHGPCGHAEGDAKLAGILLALAPPYPFSAYVAECAGTTATALTPTEQLFLWLMQYDKAKTEAWTAVDGWPTTEAASPRKTVALVLLWGEATEFRESVVAGLREGLDVETDRLALQILNDSYPDPFARGLGTDLDVTGTLYRAAFAEAGIFPLCLSCPAEPRGSATDIAWAEMFLALHMRQVPSKPSALAKLPQVQLWIERFHSDNPLLRAQAALVLWRLQTREAPR